MSGIRKNQKSQLHQGTKIEARKPLDVPVHTATTTTTSTESLSLNFSKIEYQYSK
jgi:hypothetical protein